MAEQSRTLLEALDGIRDALAAGQSGNIEYPQIANGPVEHVLAFNNDEYIALKDPEGEHPYFSSHGVLTDLQHRVLPGSKVETTFPVDRSKLGESFLWPPQQQPPFDGPPVDNTHTTGHGYSKQAYFFGDGSSLVTVGPSLPKIGLLKGGGAQFWVASLNVVAQGTGKYAGAHGTAVYIGSAYLETWPASFPEQAAILAKGFKALVGTYFKLVLAEALAPVALLAKRAGPAAPAPPARKQRRR
jgi:hypothetical protein